MYHILFPSLPSCLESWALNLMAKAVAFHPHISGRIFSLFLSPQEIALTFGETEAKFSLCRFVGCLYTLSPLIPTKNNILPILLIQKLSSMHAESLVTRPGFQPSSPFLFPPVGGSLNPSPFSVSWS